MSTPADVSASRRKPLPVYKRKRRRIYGAVAAALVVIIVIAVWAVAALAEPLTTKPIRASQMPPKA